jgi:hypothetical protein
VTVTALGSLTLATAIPAIPLAIAQLSALIAPLLSDQTKLVAAIANPLTIPDLSSYIDALNAAIANALAALAALPALTVTLKADLNVQLSILGAIVVAAQALLTTLTGVVSTGGISGYIFDGHVGAIGSELQAAIDIDFPVPSASAKALVLLTAAPATWTAMGTVLKTAP